ncbi:sensor histidine kinase [Streptomyces sp. LaPpAH-108]|uniref:sensor histidine kinase n=1 Tax=Streptomyces sp. LaPpAH-108 TaxID=1155714 RepID=UPI001319C98E|nr:histidine kinase [Streptomyces sp. LaPpAH-108]
MDDTTRLLRREDSNVLAPRLARTVLLTALIGYSLVTAVNILSADRTPTEALVGFTSLLVVSCLQLAHSRPSARQRSYRDRVITLGIQALFCFVPLTLFHAAWGAMSGFLAGSVLLLLPTRVAWPLYGAIGIALFTYTVVTGHTLLDSVYTLEATLITGLVVFGLTSLAALVSRLHAQREELARLAVANERLRFAQDLHDLLGYNLSAITLKTELVRRLVPDMPAHARNETDSILTLSRQSLADVRQVATGYRNMSLHQEVAVTRSMLEAAGVKVETTIEADMLPEDVDAVLAIVVREGITNALRHSQVHHCTIRCREQDGVVTLTLGNDGVTGEERVPAPTSEPGPSTDRHQGALSEPGGSGLGNLTHRLTRIGGSLTIEKGADDWFRVTARVPLLQRPRKAISL